ncbi:rRNA-processing protein FCF1-like protein [Cocos nucifera]|uniref:rRNA-processing protein FCF1-like protein n=1 Tax=Cocos nucifera TaxID=13894 RepID=A0A8K0I3Y2_COCNU|nr:rRNA-processing protein FCF1-like protein [Cocos nucifera]
MANHEVARSNTKQFMKVQRLYMKVQRLFRDYVESYLYDPPLLEMLDLEKGMMDCLYAKCTPCITDCVMAELEKLGQKYRVALRIAKDPRFERLPCTHKGTYADDCIVERVTQHKCYIVATCDRDLKRRIRKLQEFDDEYCSANGTMSIVHQMPAAGYMVAYFSKTFLEERKQQ